MARRRHRKPVGSNRPDATGAYVIAGISLISAITFFLSLLMSVRSAGNTANWIGGIGVLFLIAGLICIVAGFGIFRNTNYTLRSRLMGFLVPIVPELMWVELYILGILHG